MWQINVTALHIADPMVKFSVVANKLCLLVFDLAEGLSFGILVEHMADRTSPTEMNEFDVADIDCNGADDIGMVDITGTGAKTVNIVGTDIETVDIAGINSVGVDRVREDEDGIDVIGKDETKQWEIVTRHIVDRPSPTEMNEFDMVEL